MPRPKYTKADLEQVVYTQLDNLNAIHDLLRVMKLQNELIIQQARNNPIPYTFCLHSSALSAKRVFHYIFKETFRKKKIQENWVKELRFYQSKVT